MKERKEARRTFPALSGSSGGRCSRILTRTEPTRPRKDSLADTEESCSVDRELGGANTYTSFISTLGVDVNLQSIAVDALYI